MAREEAKCVWENGEILRNYVSVTEAKYKKQKYKVPAYRHPDPLLYPIFCDYGNSRWEIKYSVREPYRNLKRSQEKLEKSKKALEELENKLEELAGKPKNDKNNKKLNDTQEKYKNAQRKLEENREKHAFLSEKNRMSLRVLSTENEKIQIDSMVLMWQSKRLRQDLAFDQEKPAGDAIGVSRANRLGLASANVQARQTVTIQDLFEQNWNGRLQAPRDELRDIAKVRDNGRLSDEDKRKKIDKLKQRLRWFITFSPSLEAGIGPWNDYLNKNQAAYNLLLQAKDARKQKANEGNENEAKLILSRLHGLRVLSADLGHRHAAACAVWET